MSGQEEDRFVRAIDDARALLDTLLARGWQEIHVVSGDTEIFIAREGGRPNPMRQQSAAAPPPPPAETSAEDEIVTAPHVATLVDVVALGTEVAGGDRIATLRVLDEEETVVAPGSGRITAIHADAGALIEFKAAIVSFSRTAG